RPSTGPSLTIAAREGSDAPRRIHSIPTTSNMRRPADEKNVSMKKTMKDQSTNSDRRDFLKATTGALGAISAFPGIISAQTVTNAIKIGLIGCGGRGSGAASQALQADDYGELTALADIDQGNVEKCLESLKRYPKIRDRIKVEDANRFLG